MNDVRLIAAVGNGGQLGLNGRIPWHDPEDLRWFRSQTMGHVLIVGMKTFLNLPELSGRTVVAYHSSIEPESLLYKYADRTIWIAGGARTYRIFMPYVKKFVISRINYDGPSDVSMTELCPWYNVC